MRAALKDVRKRESRMDKLGWLVGNGWEEFSFRRSQPYRERRKTIVSVRPEAHHCKSPHEKYPERRNRAFRLHSLGILNGIPELAPRGAKELCPSTSTWGPSALPRVRPILAFTDSRGGRRIWGASFSGPPRSSEPYCSQPAPRLNRRCKRGSARENQVWTGASRSKAARR